MTKKRPITKWMFAGAFFLVSGFLTWTYFPSFQQGEGGEHVKASGIDKKADKTLRDMSNTLAILNKFSFSSKGYLEVVDSAGQKTRYDNQGTIYVDRPAKIKAERMGELSDAELYLKDGNFTVYGKKKNMYAVANTPANIDKTIQYLQDNLDIYMPASDLLYSNVYKTLTEDVISGTYVGQSMVGNVMCDELSFKGNEVDWKIWVESARKLPRKYIIISKKEQSSAEAP